MLRHRRGRAGAGWTEGTYAKTSSIPPPRNMRAQSYQMDPLVAAVTSVVVAGTPYFATTTPLVLLESSKVEHQVSFTGVFGTVVSHDAWATLNTAVRATEISSSMACALVGACDASPTGPARGAVQGKLTVRRAVVHRTRTGGRRFSTTDPDWSHQGFYAPGHIVIRSGRYPGQGKMTRSTARLVKVKWGGGICGS